ncbi:MAG: hypothetical protein M3N06_02910 [Pseudomonadota bacterium]|nr:hypothetical protein [Pseudomonadota bacterium]
MTASTRFLGFAVLVWAGVRTISLGLLPGSGGAIASSLPAPSAVTPLPPGGRTEFAPIDPVAAAAAVAPSPPFVAPAQAGPAGPAMAYAVPAYYPVEPRRAQSRAHVRYIDDGLMPEPRRLPFSSSDPTPPDPRPLQLASAAMPPAHSDAPAADSLVPPLTRRSKRLELSTWAMTRGKPGQILGPNSLAADGATLGGSQAGARMTYWIDGHLGASLRVSTPLGGARGGEAALGVRYRPFTNLPFAVTAERRQRFGRAGGRNDFALFAEGGLWDQPMPAGFRLDAYAQAGVVGLKAHDPFGDGAFTLTRPLWRNISGGFGMWGGAQPHLYRLDAGPRLTIAMKHGMKVHVDYRQRLAGTAFPSSGLAVTIAGDF